MRALRFALSIAAIVLSCSLAASLALAANRPGRNPTTAPTTAPATAPADANLQNYPTKYYALHYDLAPDDLREVMLRLTKMHETFHKRTTGYSSELPAKLPAYFYSKPEQYLATGAPPKSLAVVLHVKNANNLLALIDKPTDLTWQAVQEQSFLQYAAAVIRGDLPPWVLIGLSQYFGEALYTGDDYITGVIPPERLAHIKTLIANKKFKPLKEFLIIPAKDWLDPHSCNDDQAWALVHFLLHANDAKYQKGVVQFMNALGQGQTYHPAWISVFGPDIPSFQTEFETWWTNLPEQPKQTHYQRSDLAILTSFLARADSSGQHFENAAAFFSAAQHGDLKIKDEDWIPPSLLKKALKRVEPVTEEFVLQNPKGQPSRLIRTIEDGKKLIGTYVLGTARVRTVTVTESNK